MRVPQRDRIRIMRCLYTMLLWAAQRIADRVRARERSSFGQCRSRNPV